METEIAVDSGFRRFMDSRFVQQWEPKLIGLTGKAHSGKDTVGKMLNESYGAQQLSFAEPIRNMLRAMLPSLTHEHFHGEYKEVALDLLGKSPRQMMQTLGTEWGRQLINDTIWLKLAGAQLDLWSEQGLHAVITDVRFENEAEMIRNRGGVVWHVTRNDVQAVAAHVSEAGVAFRFGDVLIENNGSLEGLYCEVCDAF